MRIRKIINQEIFSVMKHLIPDQFPCDGLTFQPVGVQNTPVQSSPVPAVLLLIINGTGVKVHANPG